ncbi:MULTISPECIES: thioesterase family protein [unclassified Aureispira]|uniref:acyl-CoA thioesterase n=1 Tax=unclassified Aureispira TaxID=2649989 RepID=UPI00069622AE|nr:MULTISPECIES: thioesterase family protein [unclassified Aureispira]WMX15480.1 thioesterase family protein [Aureispira sp. CCB-E]
MRAKLKDCKQYVFTTSVRVRITDLNYGGHVGNEMMLIFAQQARVDLLKSWGYGELTLAGKGIIMTDAVVLYKSESHEGDELKIEIGIDDLTSIGFDLYYKITNAQTNREVARVKTGILCFDYGEKKIASLPQEVVAKINALL